MNSKNTPSNTGIQIGDGGNISARNVVVGENATLTDNTDSATSNGGAEDESGVSALPDNSIFVSYRKDDSGGWAAKLADDLRAAVGWSAVFLDDTSGIPFGTQWPNQIAIALDQCRVFLPVIAPTWTQEPNISRLRHADDWVRNELITAHTRQQSVLSIPIFVNEASPLDPTHFSGDPELSLAIVDLMSHQGIQLDRSPELWPTKIDSLLNRVDKHLKMDR